MKIWFTMKTTFPSGQLIHLSIYLSIYLYISLIIYLSVYVIASISAPPEYQFCTLFRSVNYILYEDELHNMPILLQNIFHFSFSKYICVHLNFCCNFRYLYFFVSLLIDQTGVRVRLLIVRLLLCEVFMLFMRGTVVTFTCFFHLPTVSPFLISPVFVRTPGSELA